ncbi:osteocrin [Poeciliopsis prolifica]|uniref:osteocrin n=1 Tax=Poeciliopsis prolifica TaxID=188132 RepID=UPI0024130ABD|nr:osteocrin [Poeciliopsis prolifica]
MLLDNKFELKVSRCLCEPVVFETMNGKIDQPGLRTLAVLWLHPGRMKPSLELSAKLLRTDDLMVMENDVTEPKRKRSFPGNNTPLDRLSMSSMETRQGKKKQRKVAESPRRRSNPPPIDRVGRSRIPMTRG